MGLMTALVTLHALMTAVTKPPPVATPRCKSNPGVIRNGKHERGMGERVDPDDGVIGDALVGYGVVERALDPVLWGRAERAGDG
jgi:hypothetical protein